MKLRAAAIAGLASGMAVTAAGSASAQVLEEVVVTAQKRSERLQDVPIAVTAVTAQTLQQAGIVSTTDLNAATPGLNVTTFSGGLMVFIRGIGTTNPVVGNESSVAMYLDGVYMPSFKASVFSFSNIERIEVLRGPQGTLFGRNATGGAIQVVTKRPSSYLTAEASVAYENHETLITKGYVSGPIANNLNADFAFYTRDQSGNLGTNIGTGNGVGAGNEQSFRTRWYWQPSDATSVDFTAMYSHWRDEAGFAYNRLPGARGAAGFQGTTRPFDSGTTFDAFGMAKSHFGALTISHDFGPMRFVSISGGSNTTTYYNLDTDQTPTASGAANIPWRELAQSQEFQLLSPEGDDVKWMVGAYYFHDIARSAIRILSPALPGGVQTRDQRQVLKSKSLYGQVTFPIAGDTTNLTVGARYTWDEVNQRGRCINSAGTVVTIRPNCSGAFPDATALVQRSQTKNEEPGWRVALDHKFAEDVLGYVSFNRGYKSAGYNLTNVPTDPVNQVSPKTPKPETLTSYETGLKTTFWSNRALLNVAAFYYDYKNMQVLVNQSGVSFQSNAPKVKIYGAELEGQVAATEALQLRYGASVLHHEVVEWSNATCFSRNPNGPNFGNTSVVCNVKGNKLPRVPSWTLNFGFSYDIPIAAGGLALNVNEYVNSGFYWHPDNRLKQKSYHTLAADITWQLPGDHLSLRVYGRNLTDERYWANVQEAAVGDYANWARPRTVGIELTAKY